LAKLIAIDLLFDYALLILMHWCLGVLGQVRLLAISCVA